MDDITDSMDMSLSKLREMVKDREAWHAVVVVVAVAGSGVSDLSTQSCPPLATPCTVAHQAPLPWDFPGKNTGVGSHFLLQGSNLDLLH